MENNMMENNEIRLSGFIKEQPMVTHEIEGEKFWELSLEVKRLSGVSDIIPVTVPEKLLEMSGIKLQEASPIRVEGELRSYNKLQDGKSKLVISAFAKKIQEIKEENFQHENHISLNGYICKEPIYRTTPFNREICDAILAVNRKNFKSDYLPLISWGRNAKYLQTLQVGTKINAEGRIQSRKYVKVLDGERKEKTAYEVSVQKLVNLDKEQEKPEIERTL